MKPPIRTFDDVLPSTIDALARGGIAASQAKLAPAVQLFHRSLLRLFLHSGRPPTEDDLGPRAVRLGLTFDEAMAALAEADLAHLDPESKSVAVAYPLSGRPSPHRVTILDGPTLTAMCAVDALGIPMMTQKAATIESTDPVTGDEIRVQWKPGFWTWVDPVTGAETRVRWEADTWTWEPVTAVVVLAAAGCAGPIADACNHTAFHVNDRLAHEFLADRPAYTGQVLSQRDAVAVAEQEFGPLLGYSSLHEGQVSS